MSQLYFRRSSGGRWVIIIGGIVAIALVSIACTVVLKPTATPTSSAFVTALEECAGIQQEDVRQVCVTTVVDAAADVAVKANTQMDPGVIAAASKICASIQQENIRKTCASSISIAERSVERRRPKPTFDWAKANNERYWFWQRLSYAQRPCRLEKCRKTI